MSVLPFVYIFCVALYYTLFLCAKYCLLCPLCSTTAEPNAVVGNMDIVSMLHLFLAELIPRTVQARYTYREFIEVVFQRFNGLPILDNGFRHHHPGSTGHSLE